MSVELTVKKLGINGEGISYHNKKIVFIPGALKDEVVEVEFTKEEPTYIEAEVKKIITKSPDRKLPLCRIQKYCGGCPLMTLEYAKQLEYKKEMVQEAIEKYAEIKVDVEDCVPNPNIYNYRNAIKLPVRYFDGQLAVGMYKRNSNKFVKIGFCDVQEKALNKMVKEILVLLNEYKVRDYFYQTKTGCRYLILRQFNGEAQLTLVMGKDEFIKKELVDKLLQIEGLVSVNTSKNTQNDNHHIFGEGIRNVGGKKKIKANLKGKEYLLSPKAFFQLNTAQTVNLYDKIKELIGTDNNLLLDVYAGVGSIGLYLSDCAKDIKGLEIEKTAVMDANENAKKQKVTHAKYIAGDAYLNIKNIAKNAAIDVFVVDPPRIGLDDMTVESIIKGKPKKVVYVSCNPSTLGKDLFTLKKYYKISRCIPFDMFSHTPHVETLVLLERK